MPIHALLAQAAGPGEKLDLIALFLEAGFMAKFVFAVLALLSIASWAIMVRKVVQLRRADQDTAAFLDVFRRSSRFSEVSAATHRLHATPLIGLFQAGHAEIEAQVKAGRESSGGTYRIRSLDAVERSLRRARSIEIGLLRRGTGLLATTAAAAPFIGLFGTVWGIMIAFGTIGTSGTASIAAVAPGIAEALINTAAGLGAAIPALMGYNYFGQRLRIVRDEMDDFVLEFLNLTERTFL
ncbi:MAG: MotA/TolQ/ExbB proton channel family protein [Acidobacteriota bacterium]